MTTIFNVPQPSSAPRQKSIDISDLFLTRFTPPWSRPSSLPAASWRGWVLNQSVAIVCRETLIANLLALDWKITPVNSKYKEELEPTVKYYTKLFKKGGEYTGLGLDFSGLIEWVVGDLLDLPFGGAAEVGRKGNSATGRVQWIRPIDGGTLYPTLNQNYPIVQYYPNLSTDIVVFKPWEISRTYMSPHSFILREGWGMAPPEKVYFALDMLTKGDKYYANLLLDIPTAGILDLGDMEKSSAEEWITAFKTFVNDNTTSFKIPVLYEHNNKTEFIPFGKVPNDIMFDHITLKYAALVAAAYGMSLSDIGLQTTSASGETLAGSIRQERRTRKTGFARVKAKTKFFFDNILPETLEFNWIDYDDELNVALGKARLASSQAFKTVQDQGIFSPQEIRSQWIQDGLISISLPDQLPPDAQRYEPPVASPFGGGAKKTGGNKEPEMINADAKAPSSGGEGEIKKSFTFKSRPKVIASLVSTLVDQIVPKIILLRSLYDEDYQGVLKSQINESMFDDNDEWEFQAVIKSILGDRRLVNVKLDEHLKGLNIRGLDDFLLKSMVYHINDTVFSGIEDYVEMTNQINEKVIRSLEQYIDAYIQDEYKAQLEIQARERIQEQSRADNESLKEVTTSLLQLARTPSSPNITVNLPRQDAPIVNVDVPITTPEYKSQIDVHVPQQPAPIVNVPKADAPIINVDLPESVVNVNVPKQETPVVNVSVPEGQAPIVNITNDVSPTPVNVVNPITVEVPKATKEVQTVYRDRAGNISATETEILYDDKESE
jgi:hypothetical protein